MHTEKQAREKWCPFARTSAANTPEVGNHAANRYAGDGTEPVVPRNSCCIASDCMTWRWWDQVSPDHKKHTGWCGLAGKPE